MDIIPGKHKVLTGLSGSLIEKILPFVPRDGKHSTAVTGFSVSRFDSPTKFDNCFYDPAIGIVLQGSKRSVIGNEAFSYGAHCCLVIGVDTPSANSVIEASPDKPFLSVSLAIDHALVAELIAEIPPASMPGAVSDSGISIAEVQPELLEAFSRLAGVLDDPDQTEVLAPLIVREIHYRVLIGPQGGCLRRISTRGSQSSQIAEAVTWLRENYTTPFRVDELAAMTGMATTTFHRHFKLLTSMSPLQFQKRLRLYEAQRLMLTEEKDATSACLAVGYESASQFNREYRRLFGEPPHRDINRLRRGRAAPSTAVESG